MAGKVITRFAPSPTGLLHLGHAYAAWRAFTFATERGGALILRIEDTDLSRARPEFEAAILEDLAWLGLTWPTPVRRQSEHFADYEAAVALLTSRGLTYPCYCTRKDILDEIEAAGGAPHAHEGPDGPIYPGTCRTLSHEERRDREEKGAPSALRLDTEKAIAWLEKEGRLPLTFVSLKDDGVGAEEIEVNPRLFGDVVIARKETPTSYHVSAVHDDHLTGVTHVIRGEDLVSATHIQRVLQALLNYEAPSYLHHPLVCDETGRRLAKRDKDKTLAEMRAGGMSPDEVIAAALDGIQK